jgi:uncharacterized protein (DUF305 family)
VTGRPKLQRHALAVLAAIAVAACTPGADRGMTHTPSTGAHTMAASTAAFEHVNHRMHEGMAIEFTGNADIDFLRGMIPHHQGAVDMARVVLEHGDDPEVRRLAGQIIAAQQQEIATMQRWLEQRGGTVP